MIELVARYVLPAAYEVLPAPMQSPAASAMLLAIGLQESGFRARGQDSLRPGVDQLGPACSFWMFEKAGVRGLLAERHVLGVIYHATEALGYGPARTLSVEDFHLAIRHNDVLAAVFARCLLWTHRDPLPSASGAAEGWKQYYDLWRPGKPRPHEWPSYFAEAWTRVGAPSVNVA